MHLIFLTRNGTVTINVRDVEWIKKWSVQSGKIFIISQYKNTIKTWILELLIFIWNRVKQKYEAQRQPKLNLNFLCWVIYLGVRKLIRSSFSLYNKLG